MQLLPEAYSVVKQFLPVVLEAAGKSESADYLRKVSPLNDNSDVIELCHFLKNIKDEPIHSAIWELVLEDVIFYSEAAIWAAMRGNLKLFNLHLQQAHQVMRDSHSKFAQVH